MTMITRRSFLTVAALGPVAWARANAAPGPRTAGGEVAIARVFAAGPPAAVLVYVLAPSALLGWPMRIGPESLAWIGPPLADLPVLGRLAGRGSTVSPEKLVQLKPDLVLDVGAVDGTHVSMADRVRQQTGLRYELLGGRLAESASLLRRAGALLGVPVRADRLAREAERILEAVGRGRPARASTRVYLARGTDGLETGLGGSINVEALEYVGARNVAAAAGKGGITRVSLEQVLDWDPEVVVTQDPALARSLRVDPLWRAVSAVRGGRVLCAPNLPFGWLDDPPGVNRLIGIQWLARRLDAGRGGDDLPGLVRAFYDAFYRITLSEAQLGRLLGDAP
jgi:iron complex transport system substrate-binding protein